MGGEEFPWFPSPFCGSASGYHFYFSQFVLSWQQLMQSYHIFEHFFKWMMWLLAHGTYLTLQRHMYTWKNRLDENRMYLNVHKQNNWIVEPKLMMPSKSVGLLPVEDHAVRIPQIHGHFKSSNHLQNRMLINSNKLHIKTQKWISRWNKRFHGEIEECKSCTIDTDNIINKETNQKLHSHIKLVALYDTDSVLQVFTHLT